MGSVEESSAYQTRTLDTHTVWCRGIGIHSGVTSTVTVDVCPDDQGETAYAFALPSGAILPARFDRVTGTSRCTTLGSGENSVSTVEHLLSALHGLGIARARITIDGPEVPILDGSAAPWVELLRPLRFASSAAGAGVRLREPVVVTGKGGAFAAAYPSDTTRYTVAVSFDHPLAGTQVARFEAASGDYATEVAPARTFGFIEEVEALQKAGLARGGSMDNALVICTDRFSSPLRMAGELAYHKLLDMVGDLTLACGGPLSGALDVVAYKPSHRLNVELAARVAQTLTGLPR